MRPEKIAKGACAALAALGVILTGMGCGGTPGDSSSEGDGVAGERPGEVALAATVFPPPPPVMLCTPPPSGLVDWWTFDEPSGSVAGDIAGVSDAGVHINGPTIFPGKVSNALSFDGVNDFVTVPSGSETNFFGAAPGAAEDFTIDAWVRLDAAAATGLQVILDKRVNPLQPKGYSLYTYDGYLAFQMADAAVPGGACGTGPTYPCTNWGSSSGYLADGAWHLVAVTVDRSPPATPVGALYVDGATVLTFTPRTGSLHNGSPLQIGRRTPAFGATYFAGDIDELEIFKTALPQASIQAIYNAGALGKCKPSCSDGIQNQGEAGLDCGGPCPPCCLPLVEICNGLDDDCDGFIDEEASACDDGNPCTDDICAGFNGCAYELLPDGAECGPPGTCGANTCVGGICTSFPPSTTPWHVLARGEAGFPLLGYLTQIEADGDRTIVSGQNCDQMDVGLGIHDVGTNLPPFMGWDITCNTLVAKVDSNGTVVWDKQLAADFFDWIPSLDVDSSGNTAVLLNSSDYYGYNYTGKLIQLDASGNQTWSVDLTGPGEYYLYFLGTVQIASNNDILLSFVQSDVNSAGWHYIHRYTPSGTLVWATALAPIDNPYYPTEHGLVEDAAGNIYASGSAGPNLVIGATTLPNGAIYVAKLSSSGTPLSALQLPAGVSLADLRRDSTGNLHLAGTFTGTINLGGTLVSAGGTDIVLARFDTALNILGSARYGGAGDDTVTGFSVDGTDTLHVYGHYDTAGDGSNGFSFGGPTLGPVYVPFINAPNFWIDYTPAPMYLARLTAGYAHIATRELGQGSARDLDTDCSNSELLCGKTQTLSAIDLGIPPVAWPVGFATRLGPAADACGAGICTGGAYSDACGGQPVSSPMSIAACTCGLVNPACGAGSCFAGQYCTGDACGPPSCYPTMDPLSLSLCNGGTLSNVCVVTGGTKRIFATSATFSGNLGGVAGGDALCQSAAIAASLSGTYKATLGNTTTGAWTHALTSFEGPLVRVDGLLVYSSQSDLGELIGAGVWNPIQTELGGVPSANAWVEKGCTSWTSAAGTGAITPPGPAFGWAAFNASANCSSSHPLVCLEQ